MYAKWGLLGKAQQILEGLPVRNVVSWSALIAGYVQHGHGRNALQCFERMKNEGFSPDEVTLMCILRACGSMCAVHKIKRIHEEIVNRGLLGKHIVLGTTLVDAYAKCGLLRKAKQVLEELPSRNVVTWNVIITGYTQQGQGHEALNCFEQMQKEGFSPNAVTYICALKACGNSGTIDKGEEIHYHIKGKGLFANNVALGTALVDMYAKCGALEQAKRVLEELPERNLVSWNALIAGFSQQGKCYEALGLVEQMQNEGLSPDVVTFTCILQACGSTGAIAEGEKIHKEVVRRNLLENDILLGNSLVDMYVKCGELVKAQQVLEELPIRNVISWNALITGYAQQKQCHEALNCFELMQSEGISPSGISYICILKACGSIGAIDTGEHIKEEIIRRGFLENDVVVGTALIDMYAKCGELEKAQQFLENLPVRNVVSWSAIIAGYGQQGQGHNALKCFEKMQREGLCPNAVTLLCVLSACSHSGLLDSAQLLFTNMVPEYGIIPNSEHHNCMVVALGYAGQFGEAISVIELMPSSDSPAVWLALLGACNKWGNVKLATLAFDQAIQIDSDCGLAYVIMGSVFAAAGMYEDAQKLEAIRLRYTNWRE